MNYVAESFPIECGTKLFVPFVRRIEVHVYFSFDVGIIVLFASQREGEDVCIVIVVQIRAVQLADGRMIRKDEAQMDEHSAFGVDDVVDETLDRPVLEREGRMIVFDRKRLRVHRGR